LRHARLILCLALAGVTLASAGCGSGADATRGIAAEPFATAGWRAKTQQLCREKRAAIAQLGNVHITFAGIAEVGLPVVKRKLEAYLTRLLAIVRRFAARQRQLPTPHPLASAMAQASADNVRAERATELLRQEIAAVRSASGLSSAFRAWTVTLHRLSADGDVLAENLNLPDCRSRASTPTP
jgi:hypothetical protein